MVSGDAWAEWFYRALMLVTFIKQKLDDGTPLEQAVHEGCLVRLRPVLMGALVAAVGFTRWRSTWAWAVKYNDFWPRWSSAAFSPTPC